MNAEGFVANVKAAGGVVDAGGASGPSIGVSPPAAVPSAPSWPVGHTIFGIVYAVLTSRRPFDDLGPTSTAGTPTNVRRRLTRRLEAMGYLVTIAPPAA